MRKDNTQNYQTPNIRIQHFSDFTANAGAEKKELGDVKRSFMDNEDNVHNLPNLTKMKYNKVTHKMDTLSKDEVNDKIDSLGDVKEPSHKFKIADDEVNPNHKFQNNTEVKESKIIKSFEAFGAGFVDNPQIPQLNKNMEVDTPMEDEIEGGCGCCDDCTGDMGCPCGCEDCTCSSDVDYSDEMVSYENNEDVKSYMFFGNLQTVHRLSCELSKYPEEQVNSLLNEGHNWAEDHISVTKELVSHVYNFLMNKGLNEHLDVSGVEHGGGNNYMFFANLKNISKCCEEMLEMDRDVIDELLENGHDWAEDHMAAAKEDINQVYDWLKSEI